MGWGWGHCLGTWEPGVLESEADYLMIKMSAVVKASYGATKWHLALLPFVASTYPKH